MTAFTTIRTVGAALPADVLAATVSDAQLKGLTADDYHLEYGVTPREAANRAWSVLTGAWQGYREAIGKLPESDRAVGITREKWLAVVLRELGFGRVPTTPPGGLTADERTFQISHAYDLTVGQVPLHLLGWGVPLDTKTAGQPGAADRAPHAMVQEYLNRADGALWAMISNGRILRLLRDSSTLIGPSYVEFDLESMFDGEVFSDFVVLYLVCHASRFEPDLRDDATQADCWLERWRTYAAETGTRALQALSPGVKQAIEALGTGLLRHPANDLHHRLSDNTLSAKDVHEALLRLVYRLLFCFVAEDRGLLLDPNGSALAKQRYAQWFSTARLRRIATRRRGSAHPDLWQALSLVLDGLGQETGRPELALPGLGGLFDTGDVDVVVGCQLSNEPLLRAIRHLTVVQPAGGGPKRVVDYRNLGSEELGSVYESLLEFVPRYDPTSREFTLDIAAGNDRKTSGAYYTPAALIDTLLESSLDRLIDDAEQASDPEHALLALTVCDPACGSGHFLVAAAKRIASRLALVRARASVTGVSEPSIIDEQRAMHDVVDHCIFGIDINPMAAELAKVSLWLESVQPGRALSFLDGHIKVGNALLGATPSMLASGIPDEAFTALEGDDRAWVASLRKRNRLERDAGQDDLFSASGIQLSTAELRSQVASLEALPRATLADVHLAAKRLREVEMSGELRSARLLADAWCSAFLVPKSPSIPSITHGTWSRLHATMDSEPSPHGFGDQGSALDVQLVAETSQRFRFFHWHLEFPQVFTVSDLPLSSAGPGWTGGFACVVGNPPWDNLSPDSREFFGDLVPDIRGLSKAEKDARISELLEREQYRQLWADHQRTIVATVHFLKCSGRYALYSPGNLGKGDFNVYRMFVETALTNTGKNGFAAQVTPGGLYGGANASAIRKHLLDRCRLMVIFGLINTGRTWFPGVDIDRFAAYSAQIGGSTEQFEARFGLSQVPDLEREGVRVPASLIRAQAPDTYGIPDLRNALEMRVASKMVTAHPAFGDSEAGPPRRHYQREVDMTNDSHLFGDDPLGLPVYEGRMVDAFDHRAKLYVSGHGNSSKWSEAAFEDTSKAIVPQWRIARVNIPKNLGDRCDRYRLGFCDIANPRNERSFVAALIPPGVICGNKIPTIDFDVEYEWAYLPWLAVANSFAMDWLTRTRLSSLQLSLTLMDGLPFPRYAVDDPVTLRLAPLVLRLTCTSPEMSRYWNTMSQLGFCEPIADDSVPRQAVVETTERAEVRAEIDAIVAKAVFGMTEEELSYVLDQFPVLEKRDRRAFGAFTTKDRILRRYRDA